MGATKTPGSLAAAVPVLLIFGFLVVATVAPGESYVLALLIFGFLFSLVCLATVRSARWQGASWWMPLLFSLGVGGALFHVAVWAASGFSAKSSVSVLGVGVGLSIALALVGWITNNNRRRATRDRSAA